MGMKTEELEKLQTQLKNKQIISLDPSTATLSSEKQDTSDLSNKEPDTYNFSGDNLVNFDFSGVILKNISFYKATLINCDFENATIENCDFRHSKITDTTFKEACFIKTDFHQAAFKGMTIFQDSKFMLCSLSYISFENYCITRHNLPHKWFKPILIQENKKQYNEFLQKMVLNNEIDEGQAEKAVDERHREAARIYRQFSALWESKGHNKDSEWAYIQSKRMELCRFWGKNIKHECKNSGKCSNKKQCNEGFKCPNWIKGIGLILSGFFVGYGVRLYNLLFTFLLVIATFALVYSKLGIGYPDNLITSLGFTIGIGDRPPLGEIRLYIATMVQTAIGIFLLGVFGFMVANKIRKS